MSDNESSSSGSPVASSIKDIKVPSVYKSKSHPPVAKMVIEAIGTLNERKGSSMIAIKKYMNEKYLVDTDRLAFHIKK